MYQYVAVSGSSVFLSNDCHGIYGMIYVIHINCSISRFFFGNRRAVRFSYLLLNLEGIAHAGVIARQRRDELYNINTQLRQINLNLRRQARVESYAPSLKYAPVAGRSSVATAEPVDLGKEELLQFLRSGKRLLREQNPAGAFLEFEKALQLARKYRDTVEEKKAARGLGKFGITDDS